MRWEDENWIKVYTRDTAGWLSLSWQARGLSLELSRKLEKTGELSLGRKGLPALAVLLRCEWEEIASFVQELIDDGRLAFDPVTATVTDPQHASRQSTAASNAERQRRFKEKAKLQKAAEFEESVTRGNAPVTPSNHKKEEKEKKEERDILGTTPAPAVEPPRAREVLFAEEPIAPEPPKSRRKPEEPCPTSAATPAEVAAWSLRWGIPPSHAEFQGFLDHHRKNDSRWRDWAACWRTWLRNAERFGAKRMAVGAERFAVQSPVGRAWKMPEGLK